MDFKLLATAQPAAHLRSKERKIEWKRWRQKKEKEKKKKKKKPVFRQNERENESIQTKYVGTTQLITMIIIYYVWPPIS